MTGKYNVRIENRNLIYDFTIRRNITIIRGNSATGKTTLIDMLSAVEHDGDESGITLRCEKPCVVLTDVRWKSNLMQIHDSIVFIDEDYHFMRSQDFAEMVRSSDNYYVLVTRDNLYNLPYSVDEIYGIHISGKYSDLKKTYNEFYHVYGEIPIGNSDQEHCVISEDSNSGYYFFSSVASDTIQCISAGGKTNIYKALIDNKDRFCLVIADGAAFGPEMEKISEMISSGYKVSLYLPESFEWIILKSGIIDGNRIKEILAHPEDYIDSRKYFSWERFFTSLLINETDGTYLKYAKNRLNQVYLNDRERNAILDVLPDGVKQYITGED